MEDSRQYLRQASEQLNAGADFVSDVGTRSTVSFLASELADVARDGNCPDVERFRRALGTLETRLSGSAVTSVRQAQRNLDRYERVTT